MKMNSIIEMAIGITFKAIRTLTKVNSTVVVVVCLFVLGSAVCVSCDDDITPDYINSDGTGNTGIRPADGKVTGSETTDPELPDSIKGMPDDNNKPGLVNIDDDGSSDDDSESESSADGTGNGGSVLVRY